jgi:O-antigen/teichoic acid export membrane protein
MTERLSQRHRKWTGWFWLFAGFGSVQMVIQAVGFLSGIIIVRHLSKPDYALFSIASAMMATMGMLADSGVSAGLYAIGGGIWQDNHRMGKLLRTALNLRSIFAIASTVIVTPILVWMLAKNQATALTIAIITPVVVFGFLSTLSGSLLSVVLSLRQKLREIQSIALMAALLRLTILAAASFMVLDARVATIVSIAGVVFHTGRLHSLVRTSIEWNAPPDADYRQQILRIVQKQAPLTLYFCIQSQVAMWLISIFGTAHGVAEVGALSRFGMIFAFGSSLMNSIVMPRFARCQSSELLRARFSQIIGIYVLLAGAIVACGTLIPNAFLWLLGAKYGNLQSEVGLVLLGSGLSALGLNLFSLVTCKGWIPPAVISIPLEILAQITLIFVLDISSVRGILLLNAFGSIPPIVLSIFVAAKGIRAIASTEKVTQVEAARAQH